MDATQNTLTKDQVRNLSKDINLAINNDLQVLIDAEKIKVQDELNTYIAENTKSLTEISDLYSELETIISTYNKKVEPFGFKTNWSRTSYEFTMQSKLDVDKIKKDLIQQFYNSKKINSGLEFIVGPRIKAILCTLNNTAYEDIVKIVREKLNLNDLFDNRQKYLN